MKLFKDIFFILLLVGIVSAETYIERMRELDARIICFLLFSGPLVALFLLGIGGLFFIASQSSERRESARSLIYNALFGLVLVMLFVFAAAYLAKVDLSKCFGAQQQIAINCADFSKDCENCIDKKCAFCPADKICYAKDECKGKCYSGMMPEQCAFLKNHCTGSGAVVTSKGEIVGWYIPC